MFFFQIRAQENDVVMKKSAIAMIVAAFAVSPTAVFAQHIDVNPGEVRVEGDSHGRRVVEERREGGHHEPRREHHEERREGHHGDAPRERH
ncbi:hypothetical protein [Methylorubrum populi]|jgi:hypothetical protein|uniref:hypothetical protein n=1 Tax=Methylorubrum populi TaxID=223967 RepID=UPI001FCEAA0A|nr:hypothetical protein [Methylorubrum populi]